MNVRYDYQYADGNNYKQGGEFVLDRELEPEEIDRIAQYLDAGEYFVPMDVGLRQLHWDFGGLNDEDDHPWHTLQLDHPQETIIDPDFTADEFIAAMASAKKADWPSQMDAWKER